MFLVASAVEFVRHDPDLAALGVRSKEFHRCVVPTRVLRALDQ
ncbi:hypothetical protein FM104_09330 [Microbacterium esteraromaticum]|uniref:Uncharacterized protein n=1 Tax=Microbacterium esteraromaticum TaxID=57043 RepID=A0A1R4JX62_9MICO|nr:hypothetical protein FM104_09330 [Microbacterium esteraromaticum]